MKAKCRILFQYFTCQMTIALLLKRAYSKEIYIWMSGLTEKVVNPGDTVYISGNTGAHAICLFNDTIDDSLHIVVDSQQQYEYDPHETYSTGFNMIGDGKYFSNIGNKTLQLSVWNLPSDVCNETNIFANVFNSYSFELEPSEPNTHYCVFSNNPAAEFHVRYGTCEPNYTYSQFYSSNDFRGVGLSNQCSQVCEDHLYSKFFIEVLNTSRRFFISLNYLNYSVSEGDCFQGNMFEISPSGIQYYQLPNATIDIKCSYPSGPVSWIWFVALGVFLVICIIVLISWIACLGYCGCPRARCCGGETIPRQRYYAQPDVLESGLIVYK